MTVQEIIRKKAGTFQLTSSRRGWQWNEKRLNGSNHFNSHPHEEDDRGNSTWGKSLFHFNSHPHEEDDFFFWYVFYLLCHFNSHPHEEDDGYPANQGTGAESISTHILTKRMTTKFFHTCFTSLFQLTSSRRGWQNPLILLITPLIFQLTSSRRGWHIHADSWIIQTHFNSHPHEEDDRSRGIDGWR